MNRASCAHKVNAGTRTISRWIDGRIPEASQIERIADGPARDYNVVATNAGYRPTELTGVNSDSRGRNASPASARSIGARPGCPEAVRAQRRFAIDVDR